MKLRYKILNGFLGLLLLAIVSLAIVISYSSDCEPMAKPSAASTLMKAVVARCYGSPDVLEYVDIEKPQPADDEVLVKVRVAAVNPLDWHFMRGSPYVMRFMSGIGAPDDSGTGVDFAGTVEAVGSKVTKFKPGDEVFGGYNRAFAEFVLVPEKSSLVLKPDNVSFEQAAAMPIAAITALQALRDLGEIKPGYKVLINGASGGVGTYAVQIAKSLGAEVTGVCSTRNVAMVRSIGADYVVDYKQQDYTQNKKTYDLIVDNVGNHAISANKAVLEPNGRLVIVGGPKGDWIGPLITPIKAALLPIFKGQDFVKVLFAQLEPEGLAYLGDLMQAGKIKSVIDRRYSLSEVADAIRYSETGRARGKIIITVP